MNYDNIHMGGFYKGKENPLYGLNVDFIAATNMGNIS
jgi:hypothetical protein